MNQASLPVQMLMVASPGIDDVMALLTVLIHLMKEHMLVAVRHYFKKIFILLCIRYYLLDIELDC